MEGDRVGTRSRPDSLVRATRLMLAVILGVLVCAGSASGAPDEVVIEDLALEPTRTGSPRETLLSIERLSVLLEGLLLQYLDDQSRETYDRIGEVIQDLTGLFDLGRVPESIRREVAVETAAATLDILRRIELPPSESIPHIEDAPRDRWRIPETPLVIRLMESGPREGEYLFDGRAVVMAPEFAARVRHLPLREPFRIESLSELAPQVHGPLIPVWITARLPEALQVKWLGTPIWKSILIVPLVCVGVLAFAVVHRAAGALRERSGRFARSVYGLATPIAAVMLIRVVYYFIRHEINIQGSIARIIDRSVSLAMFLLGSWLVWVIAKVIVELIIRSPRIAEQSIDANLLRLTGRVLAVVAIIVLWLQGAEDLLGIPIAGLLTGLGIGGLAVALAVRPTLENLIGGFILYVDKPVRVGDYCSFGDSDGTIERIGARSTCIRGLDRTLTSVPNAQFVDMQLTNWASCDRMQILTTIGLRYETKPDQLRWVLAKLREMCHAHPKIDRGTVRVRFVGYGPSSLDIQMRVYALTREWNEFFAIREDLFMRVNEIVSASGTGFAFPSQTLYLGRDEGMDEERSERAISELKSWRRSGRLPFPTFSEKHIDEISGTLDYPPKGSMLGRDDSGSAASGEEGREPLSAPVTDPEAEPESPREEEDERERGRA